MPQGRAAVEHALTHVRRRQGHRARNRGYRQNLLDLRRGAVVCNLHAMWRLLLADAS